MRFPDTALAAAYPTVGPSGFAELDVNGLAGGIELYLGREALSCEGTLRPVRWQGYVEAAKRYQGEVEGKGDIFCRLSRRG